MNKDRLLENLEKRGFKTVYFDTKEQAAKYILSNIKNKTVGIGGSETVKEMGLGESLKENNKVFWHWDKELVDENGVKAVRDMAQDTDIYLTSVNAISEEGSIINIDGTGNRIASTCYGHEKTYFLVGENKVEPDFEKAMWRARNIAAPKNSYRLKVKTPCAIKGDKCYDCNSPERICRGFLVIERPMKSMEMEVVLIGERLGF